MFAQVATNDNLNSNDVNNILIKLYETNYFEDVKVKISLNILQIEVLENPI